MNEFKFEELLLGQSESFEYIVTEEKMRLFLELSGDKNPLHTDEYFAKEHGFLNKVVYGMLSASLISTMGGMYLPGKYCLIQQIESKFLLPVYCGEVLTVEGKVKELNESVKQVVIQITIRNKEGKKVVKAVLKAGFLE